NADHVVPRGGRTKTPVPPEIVGLLMRDPGEPSVIQRGCHLRPDEIDAGDDRGIEVRVDWILEGRDEEAHAVRAHLMHVGYDLRKPFLVQHPCDEPCLVLRQYESVMIGVVAYL